MVAVTGSSFRQCFRNEAHGRAEGSRGLWRSPSPDPSQQGQPQLLRTASTSALNISKADSKTPQPL